MANATRILRNRIVLVFDFDGTLGPSTTETLMKNLDMDYEAFNQERNRRIEEGWHNSLATADLLREYSHREDPKITESSMRETGRNYPLFDGVDTFVERLTDHTEERDGDIELHFVLLTAGFLTIPCATPIAEQFYRLYGGALKFDDEGRIKAAKRIVNHVDKVQYIRQLAEGRDLPDVEHLEDVYLDRDPEEYFVPLDQIIYVGDGSSDMSAFQEVVSNGGVGIAIDPEEGGDWAGYEKMAESRRIHNIAKADYTEGSELMQSMQLALDGMIARIKLLRLGEGK